MRFRTFDRMGRADRRDASRLRLYVAAACFSAAAFNAYIQHWFSTQGLEAGGQVIRIERPKRYHPERIYVRYRHPSGRYIPFSQHRAPYCFLTLREGQSVPVLYSPYRPHEATIAHRSRWGWSVVFVMLGGLVLSSGYLSRFVTVEERKPRDDDEQPTIVEL